GAIAFEVLRVLDCGRGGHEAAVDATDERGCSQTIRTVNRVVAFTRCEQPGNVRALIEVDPQPTHRIVHTGKDPHRHVTWIVADKHLVDLEDRSQFSIENFGGNVCEIEINLILSTDA